MLEGKIEDRIINNIDLYIIKQKISTVATYDNYYNGINMGEMIKQNNDFKKIQKEYDWYFFLTPNHNKTQTNLNMSYTHLSTLDSQGEKEIYNWFIKMDWGTEQFLISEIEDGLYGLYFKDIETWDWEVVINLSWKYRPIVIISYNNINSNDSIDIITIYGDNVIKNTIRLSELNTIIYQNIWEEFFNSQGKIVEIKKETKWIFNKKLTIKLETCYNPLSNEAPFCIEHYNNKLRM